MPKPGGAGRRLLAKPEARRGTSESSDEVLAQHPICANKLWSCLWNKFPVNF
ncbi:MAG TPA: hypothetical protein VNS58_21175 [Puia sp.]|nr:hypothetical protein [Puia sp.]